MKGNYQAYAQDAGVSEEVALSFKRFILEETAGFEQSPEADLFRVNALAQMLDRYEQLAAHGATEAACIQHVKREFKDIDDLMRAEGFEEVEGARRSASRWPTLSEDEAAQYLKENSAQLHKRAFGIALCSACCMPLMLMNGVCELLGGYSDAWSLLGLCGMFGMIALGVYANVTAKKPDSENKIKKKRFSLSARLRRRLAELKEATDEKARRMRGRGIAMLATCVIPIFLGAALDELLSIYTGAFAIMGVGGMFAMIGAGVYELVVADGEKKAIDKLLKD